MAGRIPTQDKTHTTTDKPLGDRAPHASTSVIPPEIGGTVALVDQVPQSTDSPRDDKIHLGGDFIYNRVNPTLSLAEAIRELAAAYRNGDTGTERTSTEPTEQPKLSSRQDVAKVLRQAIGKHGHWAWKSHAHVVEWLAIQGVTAATSTISNVIKEFSDIGDAYRQRGKKLRAVSMQAPEAKPDGQAYDPEDDGPSPEEIAMKAEFLGKGPDDQRAATKAVLAEVVKLDPAGAVVKQVTQLRDWASGETDPERMFGAYAAMIDHRDNLLEDRDRRYGSSKA